ncbi:MAG: CBS domain-containing protein, partial [Actinobacteria bacterium]|nr:CBS domain-containing protein [Actinomycetota bacterium]
MEIIVTHVSSDFDSFAGMVAAKKLYPNATIILPTSINQNVRKFIALNEDSLPPLKEPKEINLNTVKKIIIIDTKFASRLGPVEELVTRKNIEVIIYDHHQEYEEDIKTAVKYNRYVGATTTILVDLLKKKEINFSEIEATLFLLGIHEDTGSFTYLNTSGEDLETAAYLLSKGANLYILSKFLNLSLSNSQHVLLEKLIMNCKRIRINDKEIIISFASMDNFIEGLSVLTRKLSQIEDISVVICWVKMKEKTYVVGRSDDWEVDISKVLEIIGGGGHPQASSAVIKDRTFEEIESRIKFSLSKNIKKSGVARDIMSYPVRVADENESILKVGEILKKYGHSGIPILDDGKNLAGIITRKDIDKAIKHGLSHAPVKGFKSGGIITATPETSIDEIQRLMIENGIGRIPIMQKDEIIGIVTRKDILRYLQKKNSDRFKKNTGNNFNLNAEDFFIKEKIAVFFSTDILRIFEIVSELAFGLKYKAYLVGGIVRDFMLGIHNFDVDIVIEGDGAIFAKKLGEMLKAKVDSYEKFKTAVLVLKNGRHIDIASARVEYYDKPAALPKVEMGNIRQDLARRDFTINTLALSLNKNDFGSIQDFFGGRKDIAGKKIKILHKMSFVEDPTRIFRAVRFEKRLGFKMDSLTEKLARSTLEMDIMSELTGIRIRDEIIALLSEEKPWNAVQRLYELGALKKIGINLTVTYDFLKFVKKIMDKTLEFKKYVKANLENWRIFLIMLMKNEVPDYLKKWCFDMKIKNKDASIITDSVENFEVLKNNLENRITKKFELYKIINKIPPELSVIIAGLGGCYNKNIKYYYKNLAG